MEKVMSKFKVGDKVLSINDGGTVYPVGTLFKVTGVKPLKVYPESVAAYEHHVDYSWEEGWFSKIEKFVFNRENHLEEPKMKKGWQFHVTAPNHEINFKELAEDVDKHNPIALIHIESKEYIPPKNQLQKDGAPSAAMFDFAKRVGGEIVVVIEDKEYKFNFDGFARDLPLAQKPIIDADKSYVVIHHKLWEKAVLCGWAFEDEFSILNEEALFFDNAWIYETNRVEFKDIVEWAKKVKKAVYPKEVRNKAVVQVDFPRI